MVKYNRLFSMWLINSLILYKSSSGNSGSYEYLPPMR